MTTLPPPDMTTGSFVTLSTAEVYAVGFEAGRAEAVEWRAAGEAMARLLEHCQGAMQWNFTPQVYFSKAKYSELDEALAKWKALRGKKP